MKNHPEENEDMNMVASCFVEKLALWDPAAPDMANITDLTATGVYSGLFKNFLATGL